MSYFEYEARMYAYRLSRIDEEYDMHLNAWLNHQVTATKGNKPQFKNFKEFFDYEKHIKEIEGGVNKNKINPRYKRMANIAAEANARGG